MSGEVPETPERQEIESMKKREIERIMDFIKATADKNIGPLIKEGFEQQSKPEQRKREATGPDDSVDREEKLEASKSAHREAMGPYDLLTAPPNIGENIKKFAPIGDLERSSPGDRKKGQGEVNAKEQGKPENSDDASDRVADIEILPHAERYKFPDELVEVKRKTIPAGYTYQPGTSDQLPQCKPGDKEEHKNKDEVRSESGYSFEAYIRARPLSELDNAINHSFLTKMFWICLHFLEIKLKLNFQMAITRKLEMLLIESIFFPAENAESEVHLKFTLWYSSQTMNQEI